MGTDKRNIDTDNPSRPSQGDSSPTGSGTHTRNKVEADRDTADNKAKGTEGRRGHLRGDLEE